MVRTAETSVRLIGLGLSIILITKIYIAVYKLLDEKVAIVTTQKYENLRLFPSMSICFSRKFNGNSSENPDHTLNISRQVQFTLFTLPR